MTITDIKIKGKEPTKVGLLVLKKRIADNTGVSQKRVLKVLKELAFQIRLAIFRKEKVVVPFLGRFYQITKGPRRYWDVREQKIKIAAPRTYCKFRESEIFWETEEDENGSEKG